MHIGLYFGSFNPIHHGHLIIAQAACELAKLDRVWMVVSPQNPFKEKKNLLGEYDRLRMVELGVGDNPSLLASNVEFSLPKPSYTIDTLNHLSEQYPSYTFSLVMGADNLQHFPKWKNANAILDHYKLFVYPRPGTDTGALPLLEHESVTEFDAPLLDISSTYVRETLRAGRSVRYLVPDAVREYLEEMRAYR